MKNFKYKAVILIVLIANSVKSAELPIIISTKTPVSSLSVSIKPCDENDYSEIRENFYQKLKNFCSHNEESNTTEGRIYQENLCEIATNALENADLISDERQEKAIEYLNGFELGFFDVFLLTSQYYDQLIDNLMDNC